MRRTLFAGLAALGLLAPLALVPAADKDKPADARPIKALLVLGGCCHEYAKQKDILKKGIESRALIEVLHVHTNQTRRRRRGLTVYDYPDWAKGYDVIIHDECTSEV